MMRSKKIAKSNSNLAISLLLIFSILLHVCHGNVRRGDSLISESVAATENTTKTTSFVDRMEGHVDEDDAASSSRELLDEQQQDLQQHRRLPSLVSYGGDPGHSPLLRCEGDCDEDRDCAGNLICFQRNGGRPVPGCSGSDGSRTDYCIRPQDLNGGGPNPPHPSPVPAPVPAPVPQPTPTGGGGGGGGLELHFIAVDPPPSALPLGECEGDCDNDRECGPGLICLQRDNNDPIDGCSGSDSSRTDYCVRRGGGGGGGGGGPSPTPSNSFRLRLYWEDGYYWQETNDETFWCMECRHPPCRNGDHIYITYCNSRTNQYFTLDRIGSSDDYLIELVGPYNLCLQRDDGNDIVMRPCNSMNFHQRWSPQDGTFNSHKFEITPSSRSHLCITQRHHPKDGEVVEIEPCGTARKGDTSFWEKY